MKKMLVPTAGPVPARENDHYILSMARKLEMDVVVIHILDLGEFDVGREALDIFDEEGRVHGVNVETYLKEGNVVPTICEFATDIDADLIVMGASKGQIVSEWIVGGVLKETNIPLVIIPWGFV